MDYFHLFFFLKLFRKYFAPLTISLVLSEKVICDKNQKNQCNIVSKKVLSDINEHTYTRSHYPDLPKSCYSVK